MVRCPQAADFLDIADVAERYGDGTMRVTVDENVVFPNIPDVSYPSFYGCLFVRLLMRLLVSLTLLLLRWPSRSGLGGACVA